MPPYGSLFNAFLLGAISTYSAYIRKRERETAIERETERKREEKGEGASGPWVPQLWEIRKIDLTLIFHA